VENLLNAEVIKAAASSPLGTLSLMCLILGIVALAFFKNAPILAKIIVFALLLIGVAGFGSAILNQQSPSQIPETTRQFVIGRWQVELKAGDFEGGSFIDYLEDGSFSGMRQSFKEGRGERLPVSGAWNFTKLAKDQFRMTLNFDTDGQWRGNFRILDYNRIHNINENYVAVRVPM